MRKWSCAQRNPSEFRVAASNPWYVSPAKANTAAFLSSDAASYITGETIHVNGGMYMG